jgi:poly(A) polymerase
LVDTGTLQLLRETAHFFEEQHQRAYLVGGSLRNIVLGEPCVDWDIVVEGGAATHARKLANRLGGHYASMHEKASRVVVKGAQEMVFDVSPQVGGSLEADLRLRDFTLNALAAPLASVVEHFESGAPIQFIDPLRGLADAGARVLRAVDSEVFRRDPLRMLRAIRLATRYGLTIDSSTQGLLMRDAALLPQVAPERIHEELYAILAPNGATDRLRKLDAYGLFTVLMPEFIPARGMRQPFPHYWDVLEHSFESVGRLEQLTTLLQEESEVIRRSPLEREGHLTEIAALLHEAEQQGIFQFSMLTAPRLKLAALLHDIGKPATYSVDEEGAIHFYGHPQVGVPLAQQILRRLSASTADQRLIQQVTMHHMRPGQLGQVGPVTPRAVRRYFVDLGRNGILIAILSLADHLATLGPQPLNEHWTRHLSVVRLLLTSYIRERDSILPAQLVSAPELMRRLKLEPGPIVGQLLEHLAEAQAEGRIHSKEEALWLAEEWHKQHL